MPRKSAIPSYRLHKASGQAVVHIDGHDHYLGPHGSPESKAKYHAIVRKAQADKVKAEMVQAVRLHVDLTVAELAAKYLVHAADYYRKDGRATTQVGLIRSAINVVLAKYSHLEVARFGPLTLKDCQDSMVQQGLARTEVNRRVGLIRQMIKWGVAQELVPPSILHGLQALTGLRRGRTVAPDRKGVRPVHDTQVEAVLPFVAPAVGAMIRLQALTGMRPNEVVQMRGCDLNTSGTIWEFRPQHHKCEHLGAERMIPIGPKAQAILKPWLRPELEAFLFSPRESAEACWSTWGTVWKERRQQEPSTRADRSSQAAAVWSETRERRTAARAAKPEAKKRRKGRAPRDQYSTASYRRAIHRACDLAKIERWSPNRLRHSAATKIRRELGIEAARALLGHSDADTTAIYAERDAELARQAMAQFG